jgi:Serine/threonine protein phosphatase
MPLDIQQISQSLISNEMPISDDSADTEALKIQAEIAGIIALNQDESCINAHIEKIRTSITHYKRTLFPKMADYTVLENEDNVNIGLAELIGQRSSQEDCLKSAVYAIQDFIKLPGSTQKIVLKQTFALLQHKYGQRSAVGSTACAAITWIKRDVLHLITANLGDSAAYLIVIDTSSTNETTTAIRINALHNADKEKNPEEYQRVIEVCQENNKSLPFGDQRLSSDSGLSVSRAFGDTDDEAYGLSHKPDILTYQRKLLATEVAFILCACDGLTDNNALTLAEIGQLLLKHKDESLDKIANRLVTTALQKGSEDNISAGIAKIGEKPLSIAIFDGHGSDLVSREIGEHFYPTLAQQITLALSVKQSKRPAELSLFFYV